MSGIPPSSAGYEATAAGGAPAPSPVTRSLAAAAARASRSASPAPPPALPQSELAVSRSSHSRLGSPSLSRRSSSGLQHHLSGSPFAFPPLAAAALASTTNSGMMHAQVDAPAHTALFPPLSHPLSRAHSHASPTSLSFGPQQYETSPQLFPGSAGLPSARHGPVSPAPFDASHAGALALEPHSLTPTRGPRPEPQGLPHSSLDVEFQLPSPPLSRPVSAAGGRIESMLGGVNMNRRNSVRRVSLSAADLGLSGHFAASGMAGLEVSLLTDTGDADADADEIADGAAFSRMSTLGGDMDGIRAMEGAEGFDHTENELHSLAALHSSALLLSAANTSHLDSRSSGGGFSMISADGNSRVDLSPTTFSAARNTRTPPLLRSPAGSHRSLPSVLPPPSPTQFAAAMPSSLSSPSPVLAAAATAASSTASPSHHSPPLSAQVPSAPNLPSPVLLRHSNDEQDLLLHYPLLFDVDWQEEEGQSPSALHSLDSPNPASPHQSSSWPHSLPPKGSPVRMGNSSSAAAAFAAIGSHSAASSVHSSPLAQPQRGSFGFSPTSAATSAPILSPSSQQRKHEQQARDSALRHRSLPSAVSVQPAASLSTDALTQLKVPGVLVEDCSMFTQAVGWAAAAQHASEANAHSAAAAGGQAAAAPAAEFAAQPASSADACSPHLARVLVCSIGDLAHDSLLSSPSLARLELLIDKFTAAQLEMYEASVRERRRERIRMQTESAAPPASIASRRNTTAGMASSPTISPRQSRRRMSLTASAAAAAAVAFSTSARRSSNSDLQFADPRESSASPSPPASTVQFELPLPAKLALQQVCDLLLQMASPDCPHPELSVALLDVLHLVLQRECPLSLANSLSQPNADVEECWLPLWQWLHAVAVDESRTPHTRSQAMDTLLLLALARGSLFMMLHLLSALLIPSSASLKIPAASLMLVREYCKLVHATPQPNPATESMMQQLPLITLVDTSAAAAIIATYMQALTHSACPLYEEHLSAAHLSSSNPNNQGVSYRALCVDTSVATVSALLQLFQELYDRVQQLRDTADAGKGEESTEAELRNLVAVIGALLPILSVHCHQMALQDSGHRDEHQALLLPYLPSIQSLLAFYPAATPLLAELGSPAAFCLAFTVPLLWPSISAQLTEVTRVLSLATAAWRDPTTHYSSPSELLFARLMLRRLSGVSFAQLLVLTLYPRARHLPAAAGKDLSVSDEDPTDSEEPFSSPQRSAVVELFIAQLGQLIEAAAVFTMTPVDASGRMEPVQLDLLHTAFNLLECFQQQLLCIEMQHSLAGQQNRSSPSKSPDADLVGQPRLRSHSTADLEEKPKVDDEEHESAERSDAIHAPAPTTFAFPPTLPQLPHRDADDSYFMRFAPMMLTIAEKLTTRAVSLARQRSGTAPNAENSSTAAAGMYLQFLRSLVTPLILTSCKLCTPLRPTFSLAILPPLTSFVESLSRLSPLLLRLVSHSPMSSDRTVRVLQTFESAHPYRPFTDKEVVLSLPTATTPHLDALVYPPAEVKIRFDASKCATHTKYDYVELFAVQPAFKDARSISEAFAAQTHAAPTTASVSTTGGSSMPLKAASLSDRWSGSHVCGSWHWPATELVFHHQHVLLHFCTAATTRPAVIAEENSSYFGYRVTVESTYQLSPRFVDRASTRLPRWFSHCMQAAAWLAASSAAALIKAEPTSESETRSYQWLRSFLFSGGFEKSFMPHIRAAPSSSMVLPSLALSVPGSEAASTGPSAHASHKHSRAASFNAASFSAMANAAAASTVLAPSRVPADDSVASQHQCFLDHLCMSESARNLSLHIAATRVHDLLKRLAATGADRQIIQRSVAAAAAQCTSSLFAVLLKHYGRVSDALACAESDERPLDPFLVRLWRKASEIKMDIRTEQSATQDVTQLVTHILQRAFFLIQLAPASGSAEIEARDGSILGLNVPDLLRRQTSSGSVSSASRQRSESEGGTATVGVSIPPSPSRVSVGRAPSLWTKDRIMSKLLRNTVRSMRIVKQLLRLRTRAADDSSAHSEEALARSVLTFVRDKTDTAQLLSLSMDAVAAQHSRATYRLTGLQAIHLLAKRLLALRAESHASFREGDSPVSLAELCLSQVSRALRALPGSVRPAASHLSLPPPPLSSPMHILSGVDSVGLEMRSFIFNEYYAFIGSFLELAVHTATQPPTSSSVSPILSVSPVPTYPPLLPLSGSAHLHLLHLCAVNFEWVKTTPLLPAGGLDAWLGGAPLQQRSGSLSRSHDMFALSRLGILQFLRPLTALLRPSGVSEWSLDSSAAPPSANVSRAAAPKDVPWSVSFSAWALFRLLAYASAPAVSGSDVDAGALEISEGVMDEVRGQLQANLQLVSVTPASAETPAVHLSLADASIAWHLHALQTMQTQGATFASPTAGVSTTVRNFGSAFSSPRSSPKLAPASSVTPLVGLHPDSLARALSRQELLQQRTQLLWVIARCCQSAAFCGRLASSAEWVPLLFKLAPAADTPALASAPSPAPSSSSAVPLSFRSALAAYKGSVAPQEGAAASFAGSGVDSLSRMLVTHILCHVLPMVSPLDSMLMGAAASSVSSDSRAHMSDEAPSTRSRSFTFVNASASSKFARTAVPFINSLLDRVGAFCVLSCTGARLSVSDGVEASQLVGLMRTLLACPTIVSQAPTPMASSVATATAHTDIAFSPVSPLFSGMSRSMGDGGGAASSTALSAAELKRIQSDWQEAMHLVLCMHIERLKELQLHQLSNAAVVSNVARLLASLWILGGGQCVLGEGSRVRTELDGQQRTGTIIRRIKAHPNTETESGRDDQWNRQIEVSGLAEDDVLFEVVLDASVGVGSDSGVSAGSSDADHGAHSPQVRSASLSGAPSAIVGDSWQLRDVYHLYASTLLPIDNVPVPLTQLSIATAADIVEAIGAMLKTSDNQQKAEQSSAQWTPDEATQPIQQATDSASAPFSSLALPLPLNASCQRLLWSDVEHRSIQALSVLIDREDIAALVLQQGISPMLIPIAIRPIALATASTPACSAADSSGGASPVESVASLETGSATLSITELELRIGLLQRCICARTYESAASALHRRRLWSSLDTKLLAERRLQLKQQDDRRRAELARLPPLTLAHADHPHVLHFFSSVYDGSYDCERCGRTKSGGCYHCAPCKFDMCLGCAGVMQAQGSAAGSPSSSVPPSPSLRAATAAADASSVHSPILRSPALVPSGLSSAAASSPVLRPAAADGQQLDASKLMAAARDSSDDPHTAVAGSSSTPISPQTKRADAAAKDKRQTVEQLQLLGFPEPLCQQAVQSTNSETSAVSWLLDQSDRPSCTPPQPSADWSLFPGGYTVPPSRLPEGWPRIKAFLASYTEDGSSGGSGEEGGDVDSFGRRTGPSIRDTQDNRTAHKATSRPNSSGATSPQVGPGGLTSGSRARRPKGRKDVNYNHVSEFDTRAHRAHYGAWMDSLLHAVSRQELAELEQTAIQHRQALAVLYARKCSLLLLHTLKDQLAEQSLPEAIPSARRLSVATLAAHTAAVRIGVPVAARAGFSAGEAEATTLGTAPPSLRRTASVAHALSSFGPVGFLATFISLLCSAPHQLATPLVSGDGRRTGLARLGLIVHTILLAERQRVQAEAQRFINAARFKTLAPIARHLLQGSLVHMMSLCRPDVHSSRRHALLNTISYMFDAFLALEESHVWHPPGAPPAVPSSSIFRASPRSSGTFSNKTQTAAAESPVATAHANMLIALFTTPVCLLMLEVIASASFALSPSSLQASAAAAAGLSDDYIAMPTGHIHALERQRLLFVRLLSRILLIRTRSMHSSPSLWHDLHRNPTERAWSAALHRKCSQLRSLCGDALEDESLAGRGSMSVTSFPHTFFLQALVNLSLVWARYERAWEALEIDIEVSRRADSPECDGAAEQRRDSSGVPLPPLPPLPPRSASPSPSGSPSSELADIALATHTAQSSLSASPLEPDAGTRLAALRAIRDRARDEHKSRWFSQLVLLDQVLAYLRNRPRGVAPLKSGRAASPSASPSASPATTRASSHGPSTGHAVVGLSGLPSDTEMQLLPAAAGMFVASPVAVPSSSPTGSALSSPPHLSINSAVSVGGLSSAGASLSPSSGAEHVERSPSPINVSDVIRPIGSVAPPSWSASSDGPSALPVAFVELFWERMQKDMFDAERKKRVEAKRREMHSSIDEYWRRERESELEAACAPWVCARCTFASPLLSSSCAMCGQPRSSSAAASQVSSETQVYFEISVVSQTNSSIGVGLAPSGYPSDNMPGWSECSYGYSGDGCIFGPGVQGQSYGPPYAAGDTVGVGYAPFKREIFFTLNGRHLGVAFREVEPMDFRAAVGCHSKDDCVRLNTGQQPFVYKHTSSKLIRRPDLHWAAARSNFEIRDLVQARWGLESCGSLLSQASLLYHGRPAPVHSDQISYFEVTFGDTLTLDTSSGAHPPCPCVAVGLALAAVDLSAPTTTPPGWSAGSYGYQGDNGCLYHSSDEPIRCYGPVLAPGDVLGCGFDRSKCEVFFTLNGRHLGVAFAQVPDEPYLATVALYHSHDEFTINFGATPFVYEAIQPHARDTAKALSPMSEGEAAEAALHATLHLPQTLSPTHNVLGAHSPCLSVSALCARHVSLTPALGVAQSSLPVVSVSPEQALLDLDAATHPPFAPLPACLFDVHVSAVFGPLEDEELVWLLNRRAEKLAADDQVAGEEGGLSPMVIDATSFEITPEERATYAMLNNLIESNKQDDQANVRSPLSSVFQFRARVSFLQCLNSALASALPLVNLSKPAKRSLFSKHFRDPHVRALFFYGVKRALVRASVAQTCGVFDSTRPPFTLRLDLFKSQKLVMQGRVDLLGTRTVFGQAFQQLHLHRHDEENKYGDPDRDPTRMMVRWRQKAWRTVFKGMYADDYGGMYRDASEKMCSELQSPLLPLFIPCPNAREQIGENRNHWVPNPSSTHPLALEMYEFLGRLMGLSLRSGDLLSLDLPGIVWKPLVDDPVSEDDVQAIDRLSFRMLHELRKLEAAMQAGVSPISPAEFSEYIDSSFVVVGSDMRRRELVPGGERIPVTWSNRDEFVAALLWYRKHEFKLQCGAMRRGLAQVVPISLLSMLTWQELRDQICGNPSVDIQLLKRLTVYEGCSAHDDHIVSFWQVMRDRLDERERAKFIQFVWGRSRLPSVASEFERKFKIQAMHHNRSGAHADEYLPVAHTCFFALELPRYSSVDVLHRKLLYAINNCVAIDSDSTEQAQQAGRNTGDMDSDEEEAT